MEKVVVSGSAGFIGGYLVEELLRRGYAVIGVDNFSKYGKVRKSYDDHPRYELVEGDARDVGLMTRLLSDCDQFVAGAAMIGGISYFHTYAYDLLATNERIIASSCDAAIAAHQQGRLKKVTYLSSSMVFESATEWPSYEGQQREIPPPLSSYGFQKLAVEYFARAAWDQHRLPYTIIRPFNCVGIGEGRAVGDEEILSGNVRLAMSHVVPDLVQKVLKGQDPLHILGSGEQVRHYTYGGDLAEGIVASMEHADALNDDFNLSTDQSTTRPGAGRADLAEDQGPRGAAPGRQRRAVRVRRAAARARDGEIQAGTRLRGDHGAGPDARRGHPLDPQRHRGRHHLTTRRRGQDRAGRGVQTFTPAARMVAAVTGEEASCDPVVSARGVVTRSDSDLPDVKATPDEPHVPETETAAEPAAAEFPAAADYQAATDFPDGGFSPEADYADAGFAAAIGFADAGFLAAEPQLADPAPAEPPVGEVSVTEPAVAESSLAAAEMTPGEPRTAEPPAPTADPRPADQGTTDDGGSGYGSADHAGTPDGGARDAGAAQPG